MANYQYDEGGSMAAYFMITFLSLILVPLSISMYPTSRSPDAVGCRCSLCLQQRERIKKREKRSLLNPKLGGKSIFLIGGWSFLVFLVYKVTTTRNDNKVYDPFEILGIRSGMSEKDIKSHYKKLSRQFHPDKVRLAANQTIESVEAYFVELTKAYKSLTDETIRKNWELYGHPDGRQEVIMGIAIPKWVVEGKNKYWVLVAYCAVVGGMLPVIVKKWWFGSRNKTKDGVLTLTAEIVFKNIKEDSGMTEVLDCLGRALQAEMPGIPGVPDLEGAIRSQLGDVYKGCPALSLLYAHLLRVSVDDPKLQRAQEEVLLRTPILLNALLNVTLSHNWLTPTLAVLRLPAYIAQAISPHSREPETSLFTQLPHISEDDARNAIEQLDEYDLQAYIDLLESAHDARSEEVAKTAERWGRLDLVEASFKVIGERIITPQSIVQLLIKARVSPPSGHDEARAAHEDEGDKRKLTVNEEKDIEFLSSKRDGEELANGLQSIGWAHAPYWPSNRKPTWWVLIADHKSNRVVMPPMKVMDVPLSDPTKERNYRAYKLQFQAPPNVAVFAWKVYVISDTFLGEETVDDIVLKVDDVSQLNADEQAVDDEISDPEEDTLEGQMAAMRGGSVKKSNVYEEDSDGEDSSTDNESSSDSSSDSD